jgi:hypothetical protein
LIANAFLEAEIDGLSRDIIRLRAWQSQKSAPPKEAKEKNTHWRCAAQECQSEAAAIRRAEGMSRDPAYPGAVAFKRTGDPNVGEFSDAVVLKKFGDVPEDLSALWPWSYCLPTGMAAAGFALSSPDPAQLIIFLYFAGLVRHRNAAIR